MTTNSYTKVSQNEMDQSEPHEHSAGNIKSDTVEHANHGFGKYCIILIGSLCIGLFIGIAFTYLQNSLFTNFKYTQNVFTLNSTEYHLQVTSFKNQNNIKTTILSENDIEYKYYGSSIIQFGYPFSLNKNLNYSNNLNKKWCFNIEIKIISNIEIFIKTEQFFVEKYFDFLIIEFSNNYQSIFINETTLITYKLLDNFNQFCIKFITDESITNKGFLLNIGIRYDLCHSYLYNKCNVLSFTSQSNDVCNDIGIQSRQMIKQSHCLLNLHPVNDPYFCQYKEWYVI